MYALLVLSVFFVVALSTTHRAHPCNFEHTCNIHDFRLVSRANPVQQHSITIHLRQNNFASACPSLLQAVSFPSSPSYGRYYSFEQIKELTWDQEAIDAVHGYLTSLGVPASSQEIAPNGEYIRVHTTTGQIERMFSAKFFHFKSAQRNRMITRSESYTVPNTLTKYITNINGIKNFPLYHKHASIVGLKTTADGSVTPNLIWSTYNMPNETDSTPLADQAVFEALGQSYSPDDLNQFQNQYNLPQQKISKVIGSNTPSVCTFNPDSCGEANLDVQYIMAMAQGAPTVYWSIDGSGDIFLDFIEAVAKDPKPPQVYSISYGGPEHLQATADMILFNSETCKMGLRGLTLFASSGDDGVAGYEARGSPSRCGFFPQYPANSPYVTIVGATMGPESSQPEVACQSDKGSIITTGGGFSNLFGQPTWQSAAVQAYLNSATLPPAGSFNATGRAYPDVAALGNNYHVIIGGSDYKVSGTSASAPVFCAMVTLVNGDREVNSKPPLGFINPLLYTIANTNKDIFNDITSGENNCCAGGQGSPTCCDNGFFAAAGWDPTTGLGSINFAKFADYLAGMP